MFATSCVGLSSFLEGDLDNDDFFDLSDLVLEDFSLLPDLFDFVDFSDF